MLLSRVRLSVRPSVRLSLAHIVSKRLDESSWVLAWRLPSTYPTLYYEEIGVSLKTRALPSGTLSQLRTLKKKFATSVALSTKLVVVVVDGRAC